MNNDNLPKDVGLCEKCGAKNSRNVVTRCRSCDATLPWIKVKAPAASTAQIKVPKSASSFDFGSLAADVGNKLVWFLIGLLIFVFSASCVMLGVFLWRYLDNEDGPYKNVALVGFICGIAGIVGRFFLIGAHSVNEH